MGGVKTSMMVCTYNNLDSCFTGFCPRAISQDNAFKCCETVLVELNTATMDRNSDGQGTLSEATSVTI